MSDLNILPNDQNFYRAAGFESSSTPGRVMAGQIDEITGRVLVDSATGTGTVTSISQGTGILLSSNPITTTGSVSLATSLQPMATLTGNALKFLRVNAGETAVEYATVAGGGITIGTTTITSGTDTRILYDNAGVVGEYSVIPVSLGGTNTTSASITAFNNITGYTASGATGTTSTNLVFSTSPVLTTPNIGVATATSINGLTITSSTGVVTITNAKTLSVTNSLTFSGTDSTVMTFPTTSATIARTDAGQTFTGVQVFTSPSITTANLSGTQLLAEGASIGLDPSGSADGAYSGITMTATAGYSQAFGDLVYLSSADSRWEAADADAATTGDRLLAMVVVAGTDGNACTLLMQGTIRADAKFPALTVGSAVYVGETAGEIQVAIPTGADNVIRRVGYALTADSIYFCPSMDSQISVA